MADFLSNLWSSVFTPGTTPTLLVATNVTFGALQALLVGLLFATSSIHFAILSVLCAGLWWSINWFATELRAAQAKEDEAEKLRKRKKGESDWKSRGEVNDSADDEGEDTEVEETGRTAGLKESTGSLPTEPPEEDIRVRQEIHEAMGSIGSQMQSSGLSTSTEQASGGAEVRQRQVEEVDRSGEISTDSEWEKISQDGDK
jgi:hypothetical protein